jgi:hypothetical protein
LLIVLEREGHISAVLGQAQRHGGTDAAASAGDQRHPVIT